MTVEALVEKFKGYILANKAYVVVAGVPVVVGRIGKDGFELTPEGATLAQTGLEIDLTAQTPTRKRRKGLHSTDE